VYLIFKYFCDELQAEANMYVPEALMRKIFSILSSFYVPHAREMENKDL